MVLRWRRARWRASGKRKGARKSRDATFLHLFRKDSRPLGGGAAARGGQRVRQRRQQAKHPAGACACKLSVARCVCGAPHLGRLQKYQRCKKKQRESANRETCTQAHGGSPTTPNFRSAAPERVLPPGATLQRLGRRLPTSFRAEAELVRLAALGKELFIFQHTSPAGTSLC